MLNWRLLRVIMTFYPLFNMIYEEVTKSGKGFCVAADEWNNVKKGIHTVSMGISNVFYAVGVSIYVPDIEKCLYDIINQVVDV